MTEHPLGSSQAQSATNSSHLADQPAQQVIEITVNLDDATPELLGHTIDKLLELGALDVWATPIVMKKSRPAHQLSLLCAPQDRDRLAIALLTETGAIGLRYHTRDRITLDRVIHHAPSPLGQIPIKVASLNNLPLSAKPEHDTLAKLAKQHNMPLNRVQQIANAAANELLSTLTSDSSNGGDPS
ncbi:hypothetical protein KS4_05820 [Poriferisphaera corsica]|uniref:DUF111 family protein n=1 Tax=Poriferisphaera corsica TaxID=2528020 RepID=A0A517YQQ8_9BACT|nr:nickel insertion protein [Poriferisphaera corsica]QDU32550.1 hypothetical protein KS4_05820 [Poriferisphaera corsica]